MNRCSAVIHGIDRHHTMCHCLYQSLQESWFAAAAHAVRGCLHRLRACSRRVRVTAQCCRAAGTYAAGAVPRSACSAMRSAAGGTVAANDAAVPGSKR